MLWAVLRRLGAAAVVLLLVSALSFLALHVLPGDAAVLQLGLDSSPEKLAALRASMGEQGGSAQQYAGWLSGVVLGDWGASSYYGSPVLSVIAPTLPVTFSLCALATLLAAVGALVLGVGSALRPGGVLDAVARTVVQAASALPGFLVAIVLLLVFAVGLGWAPVGGYTPPSEGVGAWLSGLALPSATLAVGELGPLTRIVRSSMLSSLGRDYMLAARAKGLGAVRSVLGYGLRGALAAPLNMLGVQVAKLLGGAVVVERVFSLPGLGRLLLTAVQQRDVMLLQGVIVVVTLSVVVANLVVDLVLLAADHRLRDGADGGAL